MSTDAFDSTPSTAIILKKLWHRILEILKASRRIQMGAFGNAVAGPCLLQSGYGWMLPCNCPIEHGMRTATTQETLLRSFHHSDQGNSKGMGQKAVHVRIRANPCPHGWFQTSALPDNIFQLGARAVPCMWPSGISGSEPLGNQQNNK